MFGTLGEPSLINSEERIPLGEIDSKERQFGLKWKRRKAPSKFAIFLIQWQWLPMLIVAPLFILPSPWPLIPLGVVLLLLLAIWLAGGEPLVSTPLNIPILVIAVMLLVSIWVTYDLKISIGYISGAVLGLAAFFIAARYAETPTGWWICFFFFVGFNFLLSIVVFFMIQWPQVQQKIILLNPITSHLGIPLISIPNLSELPTTNTIPGFLLGILPFQIVFTTSAIFQRKRWVMLFGQKRTILIILLFLVLTFVSSVVLILSQSRTGYISFAGTCLILLLIGLTPRGRWFLLAGVAIIALITFVLWQMGILVPWQENLQAILLYNPGLSVGTLQGRFEIWSRAIYGIQDFPFTGMGMATFGYVMPELYPLYQFTLGKILNAHNTYLQAALDLGIPGLIGFLGVQFGSLWMLINSWKIVTNRQYKSNSNKGFPILKGASFLAKPMVLGLGGVFLAYLIFGLLESLSLGVYILIWIFTGLIVGLYWQLRNSHQDET